MRILKVTAKNVKKLKSVIITPKGWLVSIAGKNRSGKSSTLDAIKFALFDAKAFPPQPIRAGEKKASIEVDCGDFKILRSITPKGNKHEVVDKDGVIIPRPMEFLQQYYCKDALDALDFFRLDKKQQRKMLLQVANIDTSKIDLDIGKTYDLRRDANREVKALEVEVAGLPHHVDAPEKELQVSSVIKRLMDAKEHNERIRKNKDEKSELEEKIVRLKNELCVTEERLEEVDAELFGIDELPEDNLQDEIHAMELANKKFLENQVYTQKRKLLGEAQETAGTYDAKLQELEQERKDLLTNAKFPVQGLAVTEECVTHNGVPLEQVSGADRVIIGASIVAARIPENGLRVLRVPTGSDLDSDSMKTIAEVAEREQVQIWLERVQDSASDSEYEFFLEDGELK